MLGDSTFQRLQASKMRSLTGKRIVRRAIFHLLFLCLQLNEIKQLVATVLHRVAAPAAIVAELSDLCTQR